MTMIPPRPTGAPGPAISPITRGNVAPNPGVRPAISPITRGNVAPTVSPITRTPPRPTPGPRSTPARPGRVPASRARRAKARKASR